MFSKKNIPVRSYIFLERKDGSWFLRWQNELIHSTIKKKGVKKHFNLP